VVIPDSAYLLNKCVERTPAIVSYTPITPATGEGQICVSLTVAPSSPVTVRLESECALFEECLLVFTPTDWDTCQTVSYISDPSNPSFCCPITAEAIDGDSSFVGAKDTETGCSELSITRAMGYSYGDPHLVTFDGVKHDFFDIGDFYLVRLFDGSFVVQARQTACAAASCNTAVAVNYQGTIFYVFMDSQGIPTPSTIGIPPASNGVTISTITNGYSFKTPIGATVSIRVGLWESRNIYYLGINVRVASSLHDRIGGLLGYYDDDPSNDYFKADGTVTTNLPEFQRSWVVGASENLFVEQENAVIPPILSGSGATNITVSFTQCPEPPQSEEFNDTRPDNSTNPQENRTTDCVPASQAVADQALALCDPPFNSSEAQCCINDLGVDPNGYYEACLCDYYLTEDGSFAYDSVDSFVEACEVAEATNQEGVTCDSCPAGCSGNGQCVNGTCVCDEGYQGTDCSLPPPEILTTPPSLAVGCPSSPITVTGRYFNEEPLECDFGGVITTASRVSDFELTCPAPSSFPQQDTSVVLSIIRNQIRSSNNVTIDLFVSCCTPNLCPTNAQCVGADDEEYSCECNPGFAGPNCDPADCIPDLVDFAVLGPVDMTETLSGKMQNAISSNVTINLTSDCVYLDKCTLTFTPDNWDIPQNFGVRWNRALPDGNCSIFATTTSDNPDCDGLSDEIIVRIDSPPFAGVGYAYGDPHYHTYDGRYFLSMYNGVVWVTRDLSGQFAIQGHQQLICQGTACFSKIAVKFGSTFLKTRATNVGISYWVVGDAAADGVVIVADGADIVFNTPTGIQVIVHTWIRLGVPILDVTVKLPASYSGLMAGLLGNFDGIAANDYQLPNGQIASSIGQFLSSWRISGTLSFFAKKYDVPPLRGGQAPQGDDVLSSCNNPRPQEDISDDLNNPDDDNLDLDDDEQVDLNCDPSGDPAVEASLTDFCDPLFNSTAAQCCKNLVNAESFYFTCLCDLRLTGSEDFAYSSVDAFFTQCENVAQQQGTTCNTCPRACSGNGDCVNGMCNCNSGYQGDACEENWNEPPLPTSTNPSSSGMGCSPVTISVLGQHFYGTSLSCIIGGITVPATKVTNNLITCDIPSLSAGTTTTSVLVIRSGVTSVVSVDHSFYPSCCENPCQNSGSCVSDYNSANFTCNCPDGFTGDLCEIVADCDQISIEGGTLPPTSESSTELLSCPSGTSLQGTATCSGSTFSSSYSCTPVSDTCPISEIENAVYPKTPSGVPGQGICNQGYTGSPIRNCNQNGNWGPTAINGCVRNQCPALTADTFADWAQSDSLTTVSGSCIAGYAGNPTRQCRADGSWGPISNPCEAIQACPVSLDYSHADFPITNENTWGVGTCNPGWTGQAVRFCKEGGVWSELVVVHCERITCPAFTDEFGVRYQSALSFNYGFGTCPQGTRGDPRRYCQGNGQWRAPFGRACT